MLKTLFALIVFLSAILNGYSQEQPGTNSFKSVLASTNSAVKYNYDDRNQVHDYSGNWDFDGDGQVDSLLFVGTGGAHLYYFMRVILSSDRIVHTFPFLSIDLPLLPPANERSKSGYKPSRTVTQFSVYDWEKDGRFEIYVSLDSQTINVNDKELKARGLISDKITLRFETDKLTLRNID
jgi:hypothetical protein